MVWWLESYRELRITRQRLPQEYFSLPILFWLYNEKTKVLFWIDKYGII